MFSFFLKNQARSLFILLILIGGFSMQGQAPISKASVPILKGSIHIDGHLNEALWKSARRLTLVKNESGEKPIEATHVHLFVAGGFLYLGWEMIDRDIQATFVKRDSRFWEEEVVEFFVTADTLERYIELQWNPLGGVFDAIITNRLDANGNSLGFEGDWSFTANSMTSKVHVKGTVSDASDKDDAWIVEVAIALEDLKIAPPQSGTEWRANFYRFNRGGVGVEKQSWSPTLKDSFHEPSRFGILKFENPKAK